MEGPSEIPEAGPKGVGVGPPAEDVGDLLLSASSLTSGYLFGKWMERGESDLGCPAGDGYLQGPVLNTRLGPRSFFSTDRRVVTLKNMRLAKGGELRADDVDFEVRWTNVKSFWRDAEFTWPEDLPHGWSQPPQKGAVGFDLDDNAGELGSGWQLIVFLNTEHWSEFARRRGIREQVDQA